MLKALTRTFLIGCAAAMLFSSSVSAQTGEFNFFLTAQVPVNETSPRLKEDLIPYAHIDINDSNLTSGGSEIQLTMEDYYYHQVSNPTIAISTTSYGVYYYSGYRYDGGKFRLRGDTYVRREGYIKASGTFTP